jgi:hypothetical protein
MYLNIYIGYVEVTEDMAMSFMLFQLFFGCRKVADIAHLYLARFFGPLKQKLTIGLLFISIRAISHYFIKTENLGIQDKF